MNERRKMRGETLPVAVAIQTYALKQGERILGETIERLWADRWLLDMSRMGVVGVSIEIMPLEECTRRIREQAVDSNANTVGLNCPAALKLPIAK